MRITLGLFFCGSCSKNNGQTIGKTGHLISKGALGVTPAWVRSRFSKSGGHSRFEATQFFFLAFTSHSPSPPTSTIMSTVKRTLFQDSTPKKHSPVKETTTEESAAATEQTDYALLFGACESEDSPETTTAGAEQTNESSQESSNAASVATPSSVATVSASQDTEETPLDPALPPTVQQQTLQTTEVSNQQNLSSENPQQSTTPLVPGSGFSLDETGNTNDNGETADVHSTVVAAEDVRSTGVAAEDVDSAVVAAEDVDSAVVETVVDHYDHARAVIKNAKGRKSIRRTHDPRLHHHARVIMKCISLFKALDDNLRLCATGIMWGYDDRVYCVMACATLGWCETDKATESVVANTPIYVIVRHFLYVGTTVMWSQLHRILATKFFRQAQPLGNINLHVMRTENDLMSIFLKQNRKSTVSQWDAIPSLRTASEINMSKALKKDGDGATEPPKKKPKLKDIKAAEAAARRAKKKEEKEREENEKKRMKKYEDQLFAKIKRDRNTYDQRKRRAIERMVATEVKAAIAKLEADYEVSTQEVQQDLTEHVNTTQETLLEMREVVTKLEARVDDVIGLKGTVDETNTLVKSHAEFIATQKKKKRRKKK